MGRRPNVNSAVRPAEPETQPDRLVDVVVVGAGPAGSAAAITAGRCGRSVVVVDKAHFPRDKCCGDGLTVGALRRLEQLGLDPAAVGSWTPVTAAVVSGPSGREVAFPLPEHDGSFAVTARRADLDAALVDVVRATGVTVLEGLPVTSVRVRADSVELGSADGTILRARHVVAADGMWSPVRKLLGVGRPDYRGEWHAFRQYFTGVSPRAERELRVWFEPDFLPGYAWSFPLGDGRANVGFGIRRGGSYDVGHMKHLWSDILGRPSVRAFLGPGAQPESAHKAWPIPARVDDTVLSSGRVLFVGDAAAATDPMTGEGIGQALATGIWAAEAISSFGPSPDRVAEAYERRVRDDLAPDHRLARLLVRALRHRSGARAALRAAALTDWTRRNFARWLFEDYPRAVLLTPDRWHAGMLHGHGAYRTPRDRPLHFADGSIPRNAAATNGS